MEWAENMRPKSSLETLNLNCLLEIFDYLDADSLIALCDASDYLKECIFEYKHTLGNKWFRMFDTECIHFLSTFRKYGPCIRKLDVDHYGIQKILPKRLDKFNFFVKSVTDYLTPGNLTHLNINFPIRVFNQLLLQCARPFFRNLISFSYGSYASHTGNQDQMLLEVIGHARKLRQLSICNTITSCDWLQFKHLLRLDAFTFRFNRLTTTRHLKEFIERKPRLKSFVFSAPLVHRQLVSVCRVIYNCDTCRMLWIDLCRL